MTGYAGALWVGSSNYTAGRAQSVQYITMHIMAGYLAGTDRIFQRPDYQASSTYGVGPAGEVHQYVDESNTA